MVKHGRNKKRRAGRIGRTKLKNRNYAKFKPTEMKNSMCKKNWDPTKSAAVNYSKMGLKSNINAEVNSRGIEEATKSNKVEAPSAIELFDVPIDRVKREAPITKEFQKYMAKCFDRYGDDYESMFRDIKLNNMQHTSTVLMKMGKKFLSMKDEEREVDVPENVKHLVSNSN